jgi:cytochrome c553
LDLCRASSADRRARQLDDFGHGARTGEWSPLMVQVVSNLDQGDMLAIVAYLASLDP